MNLDHDTCYRAVQSRDARFDGRFFTGVLTTGVYCRPVCPAVTPRVANVRFFACAAAAEQAGFRPCKRCRPESSPGTPAWLGSSSSVSRALRLIGEGALDQGSVVELAARLGLSERHLGRLFREHLGASPLAVAQTRRVHFARALIEQTDLPMIQVALAAGFGSLRRFNTLIRETFGEPPTALRARARPRAQGAAFRCRLPVRPPYAWEATLELLARHATPGVEEVAGGVYRRTLVWAGKPAVISVGRGGPAHLELEADVEELAGVIGLVGRVRRMFDCGAEPDVIAGHLSSDSALAPLVERLPGLRLPVSFEPFELALCAVLGQQVGVAAARTLAGRLVRRCGRPLEAPRGALTHLFPSPEEVAAADLGDLGLTRGRAAAVRALSLAVAEGRLDLAAPRGPEELEASLTALPGVGPWTSGYVAMRALGEPDAFPKGDHALEQAAPGASTLARAEAWRPWRAYAALYLWTALRDEGVKK